MPHKQNKANEETVSYIFLEAALSLDKHIFFEGSK